MNMNKYCIHERGLGRWKLSPGRRDGRCLVIFVSLKMEWCCASSSNFLQLESYSFWMLNVLKNRLERRMDYRRMNNINCQPVVGCTHESASFFWNRPHEQFVRYLDTVACTAEALVITHGGYFSRFQSLSPRRFRLSRLGSVCNGRAFACRESVWILSGEIARKLVSFRV